MLQIRTLIIFTLLPTQLCNVTKRNFVKEKKSHKINVFKIGLVIKFVHTLI